MPKRISDVSLHVFVTPAILERIVATVRTVLDDQLGDRDVFAWRFTLPVEPTDPVHITAENTWRATHSGQDPIGWATYEIALSLVGDPADLTDDDITELQHGLALAVRSGAWPEDDIAFTLSAAQRDDIDLDRERL